MGRLTWAIAVLLLCVLALSACGGEPPKQVPPAGQDTTKASGAAAPAGQVPRARQLIILSELSLIWLDPGRAFEDNFIPLARTMYDPLTDLDIDNPSKVNGLLAEKWDVSSDGLDYTFQLRKGVKFSTGRDMTSADVKFSLERLQNLKGNPSFLMDGVKQVEAVDPYTVRLRLAQPDASLLYKLSASSAGIIDSVEAKAQGAVSEPGADKNDKSEAWMNEHSIGTGPYVLDRWERNAQVVLRANPHSWRGQPAFDLVINKAVPDATTQAQMLARGDADIAMTIDPDRANDLKNTSGLAVMQAMTMDLFYIGMTADPSISPVMANKKVRQAVAYAIDYDGVAQRVLAGQGVTPPSMISSGLLGADSVPPYKRDLAKAKALLAEAGYPNGIEVPAVYPNFTRDGVDVNVLAQKLQSDLAEAGIKLQLTPKENTVYLQEYRAGKLAMVIAGWTTDYPDPQATASIFGGSDGNAMKRMHATNPENDKLLLEAVRTTNPEQRKAIYAKILKNIQEDANFVSVVLPKQGIGYRTDIQGMKFHQLVKVPFANLSRK